MKHAATIPAPARGNLIEGAAVSTRGLNPTAMLERAFALVFRGLVYPQIWEDPVADMAGLEIASGERIATVASGGCNAFSYLIADPAQVTAVDLNATHVALGKLKRAALLHLPDYADFRRFFGDADRAENVAAYHRYIAPHLDVRSRLYWESRDLLGRKRINMFATGAYRHGLLGMFIGFAHLLARLHGVDPRAVLEAEGLAAQRAHFEQHFVPIFDKPLIRWMNLRDGDPVGQEVKWARTEAYRAAIEAIKDDESKHAKLLCKEYGAVVELSEASPLQGEIGDLPGNPLRRQAIAAARLKANELRREGAIGDDAYYVLEEEFDWADLSAGAARSA